MGVLGCFWVAGVEQWEGTTIFAQASSSRLGKGNRSSPKGFSSNTRSDGRTEFWAKHHLAKARWPRL